MHDFLLNILFYICIRQQSLGFKIQMQHIEYGYESSYLSPFLSTDAASGCLYSQHTICGHIYSVHHPSICSLSLSARLSVSPLCLYRTLLPPVPPLPKFSATCSPMRETCATRANQTLSESANYWIYKVAAHAHSRAHILPTILMSQAALQAGGWARESMWSYSSTGLTGIIIRPEHYQPNYTSLSLVRSLSSSSHTVLGSVFPTLHCAVVANASRSLSHCHLISTWRISDRP